MQNENAGLLVQKAGKKSVTKDTKIETFFLSPVVLSISLDKLLYVNFLSSSAGKQSTCNAGDLA